MFVENGEHKIVLLRVERTKKCFLRVVCVIVFPYIGRYKVLFLMI